MMGTQTEVKIPLFMAEVLNEYQLTFNVQVKYFKHTGHYQLCDASPILNEREAYKKMRVALILAPLTGPH